MFFDILVTGLIKSSIYALLALGFSLIFGVARIVNIAHTAFYMLAAYAIFIFGTVAGMNFMAAIAVSVVVVTAFSLVCYRLVIEPIREHESAVLIATIALALIFQESLLLTFGGNYLSNPTWIDGAVALAGVTVTYQQLFALGIVVLVLLGMWVLLFRTRLGLAIRATANDLEVANLMGMNVNRIAMITVGVSVFLASVAGAAVAPLFTVDPLMWLGPLVTILAIVVLGGLGSLRGSIIGAFIIGYVEVLTVFLVPAGAFLRGAVALTIMVMVLVVRPEGLFGVVFEEER